MLESAMTRSQVLTAGERQLPGGAGAALTLPLSSLSRRCRARRRAGSGPGARSGFGSAAREGLWTCGAAQGLVHAFGHRVDRL